MGVLWKGLNTGICNYIIMKRLLLLLAFCLIVPVFAYSGIASNVYCMNATTNASVTCDTAGGWVFKNLDIRTSPSQSVNFSYKFETVENTSQIFNVYTTTQYNASGSTYWTCPSYFTRDLVNYYQCYPKQDMCVLNITMFSSSMGSGSGASGYKYPVHRHFRNRWFADGNDTMVSNANDGTTTYEPNQANRTYIAVWMGRCESITGYSGLYRPYVSIVTYTEKNAVYVGLSPRPFLNLVSPADGSIQFANFTASIISGNVGSCSTNNLTVNISDYLGNIIDFRYNSSITDGYWNYSVSSYEYGKPFYVSSNLYCNSSLYDSDTHQFAISLANTTPSVTNGSVLNNVYNPVCFYTPLPEKTCSVTTQDVYIYYNNVLYYNVNATNGTVYCLRDRNFDGCSSLRFKLYCSDNKVLIEDKTFGYCFHYQIKYIVQDFSGFIKGVMPSATNFILMFIIVGLIVAVFGTIFNAGVSSWKK